MASLSGVFSPVAKFFRELINGPDLNVVGIPVDEFTQRRRDEQNCFRDGIARRVQDSLPKLFRDDDFASLGFRVLPPRNLSPDDSKAGLIFAFDVPEMVGPPRVGEAPKFVTSLHPMQVRSISSAKSVGAGWTAAPAKVHLHDPDTLVIPVQNGRDQQLDSLLFVHRGGVIIAVNGYEQKNLTSALIQSREIRPVAEIHPLHPKNTEVSINHGVRQLHGLYTSHLRALAACPPAEPKRAASFASLIFSSDAVDPIVVSGVTAFTTAASRSDTPVVTVPPVSAESAPAQHMADGDPPVQPG